MEQEDEIEKCFTMQQKLIEVGNLFWDHNWSWTVTKQEIDYGDEKDNKMEVAVATFIRVVDKSGMHRENMGYSFISNTEKGLAYCLARKVSIVNALLETLHSFGGEISKKLNCLELNGCSINYNRTKMELISKQRHEQKVFNDNKNDNQKTNASPVNQGNYSNSNSSSSSSRINKQGQVLQPCNKSQETAPNQKSNSVYGKPRRTVPVISPATAVAPTIPNNRPVSGPHLASNSTNVFPIAQQAPIVFGVPPTNPVPVTMPPAPSGPQIARQIPNNVSNHHTNTTQGNYFNINEYSNEIMTKTIFLNQHSFNFNNCRIQERVFPLKNHSNKIYNQFMEHRNDLATTPPITREWITPTIFHDGFWNEHKVKMWAANQNDLITLTGDVGNC